MTELAGYELEVPFGPAAGVLNGANEEELIHQTKDCLSSSASLAIWGTFTWNRREGNEDPIYHHDPVTGRTDNSMGLPNISSTRAAKHYPELKRHGDAHNTLLIPSIGAGKDEDALEVIPLMAEQFATAGAPVIEIDYSCPTQIDGAGSREALLCFDPDRLEEVQAEVVKRIGQNILVLAKLAPYTAARERDIPVVIGALERAGGYHGFGLSNTIGDDEGTPEVLGKLGGMSGPITAETGVGQLMEFSRFLPKNVPIGNYLGVSHGQDVYYRTRVLPATFAGAVTLFLENKRLGISYGETCQRVAEQYAECLEAANESL